MTIATRFPKMIIGKRRPLKGPSEIQTARREYTTVKALPMVGYSFYMKNHLVSLASVQRALRGETYNLGDGIDRWFAGYVVCFKPENEGGSWLTSKWLHCCGG
jgi:hypothetical protein